MIGLWTPVYGDDSPLAALASNPSTFTLQQFDLHGNTQLPLDDIEDITAPYIGRPVSLEDLQAIRLALSQAYKTAGYISSGVLIPDQQIANGLVTMQAVEGELTRVRVSGNKRLRGSYLERRVRTHLSGPLRMQDLQQALKLLQKNQNVARLDAKLLPGQSLGQSLLELHVEEQPNVLFSISSDNHQSSSLGEFRERASGEIRNLLGIGDSLRIGRSFSEGAKDQSAAFVVPITGRDTLLSLRYSRSDAAIIESAFKALDIESVTKRWRVDVSHPVLDRDAHRVEVFLGVESKKSRSTLLGIPISLSPGSENGVSRSSVVSIGSSYTYRSPAALFSLSLSHARGIDAFNATIYDADDPIAVLTNPTRADGRFETFNAQTVYVRRLNSIGLLSGLSDGVQLLARATVQLSKDPLLSMEKLAVGGVSSVRGYRENLLVRDNGIAATLQLNWPLEFGESAYQRVVLSPFLDFGQSWDEENTNAFSFDNDTRRKRRIYSLGLTALWTPHERLTFEASWAKKISDNFASREPLRGCGNALQCRGFHLSLAYKLEGHL